MYAGIQDGSLTEDVLFEEIVPLLENAGIDVEQLFELSAKTLQSYENKATDDEAKQKKNDNWGKAFRRFAGRGKARLRLNGVTPKQLHTLRNKKFKGIND